ncbi:MAG: hypothetical protein IPL49_14190 [Saprospirales bacterium]|nr:hypothetical protein [Saprospirales bacterium]MBK8491995.1 hypothetical protein [Saprospirales bacterium]
MTSFRIRPRFQKVVQLPPDKLEERMQYALQKPNCPVSGVITSGHTYLKIPPGDRHFWSPELHLSLEPHEEGTLVSGLYGPHPVVWFYFLMGYMALAVSSLFVTIIGMSRLTLGLSANILWLLVVFGIVTLVMYLASQTGQKLGVEQTFRIHHCFEDMLGEQVHIQ